MKKNMEEILLKSTPEKKEVYSKLFEIETELSKYDSGSMSLMYQDPALVIFYFYLYRLTNNEIYYTKGELLLEKITINLSTQKCAVNFADGYSGTFWLFQHLSKKSFIDIPSDFFDQSMEEILIDFSFTTLKDKNYDFFYGGLGPCLYLMENKQKNNHRYYESIIDVLKTISSKNSDGIYWEDYVSEGAESGSVINLGMAHGIPSIIYFLSKIIEMKGGEIKEASYLLENAINWLLKQKLPSGEVSCFYKKIIQGQTPNYSSLGWCHGDLGIACAIWQAGKVLNNEGWKEEAIEIMLCATKRKDLNVNYVVDSSICHGTAGIAHIFNRFYKETNVKEFDDARWYWIQRTLERAVHSDGVAGYKSWQGPSGWKNDYSLIEGACGIGLVLMGFLTDDINDLSWDRCLLLN